MEFPDRLRLPLTFSPDRLLEDLQRLESGPWIAHFVKRNYEGDWSVIPLRGPAGATHPIKMVYSDPTCDTYTDTPYLAQCPYFAHVLAAFPFELHAARLMALSPSSRIKKHRDHDLSFEHGAVRLHVPVRTNPSVEFLVNDIPVKMAAGECWYLRLSDPHAVYNGGTESRVHLVIDAPASPAVRRLLAQGHTVTQHPKT